MKTREAGLVQKCSSTRSRREQDVYDLVCVSWFINARHGSRLLFDFKGVAVIV